MLNKLTASQRGARVCSSRSLPTSTRVLPAPAPHGGIHVTFDWLDLGHPPEIDTIKAGLYITVGDFEGAVIPNSGFGSDGQPCMWTPVLGRMASPLCHVSDCDPNQLRRHKRKHSAVVPGSDGMQARMTEEDFGVSMVNGLDEIPNGHFLGRRRPWFRSEKLRYVFGSHHNQLRRRAVRYTPLSVFKILLRSSSQAAANVAVPALLRSPMVTISTQGGTRSSPEMCDAGRT